MFFFQFLQLGQLLFHFFKGHLFFLQLALELAQHLPQEVIPSLIDHAEFLQGVALVAAEHLALAAHRLSTLLAVVVDRHVMLFADFLLHLVVDEVVHDGDQLINEPIAAGHHPRTFYLFSAVRAFGLQQQAPSDTTLAEELRAVGAHHGVAHMAETNVAGQEVLKLLLGVLSGVGGPIFGDSWLQDYVAALVGNVLHSERVHLVCNYLNRVLSDLSAAYSQFYHIDGPASSSSSLSSIFSTLFLGVLSLSLISELCSLSSWSLSLLLSNSFLLFRSSLRS